MHELRDGSVRRPSIAVSGFARRRLRTTAGRASPPRARHTSPPDARWAPWRHSRARSAPVGRLPVCRACRRPASTFRSQRRIPPRRTSCGNTGNDGSVSAATPAHCASAISARPACWSSTSARLLLNSTSNCAGRVYVESLLVAIEAAGYLASACRNQPRAANRIVSRAADGRQLFVRSSTCISRSSATSFAMRAGSRRIALGAAETVMTPRAPAPCRSSFPATGP